MYVSAAFTRALDMASWGWLAVPVESDLSHLRTVKSNLLAFDKVCPGVLTIVELNTTSSLVLTCGVKFPGVCACAKPAKATRRSDEKKYMAYMN